MIAFITLVAAPSAIVPTFAILSVPDKAIMTPFTPAVAMALAIMAALS